MPFFLGFKKKNVNTIKSNAVYRTHLLRKKICAEVLTLEKGEYYCTPFYSTCMNGVGQTLNLLSVPTGINKHIPKSEFLLRFPSRNPSKFSSVVYSSQVYF